MTTAKQEQVNALLRACEELIECAEPICGHGSEVDEYAVPAEEYEAVFAALTALGMKGESV